MLSVRTVEKIAKKVAGRLDSKKDTPLKVVTTYGTQPDSLEAMTLALPTGDRITLAGLFSAADGGKQIDNMWGPRLTLVDVDDASIYPVVDLEDATRISSNVFLKGIRCVGNFILPTGVHRATCHFTVVRKKGTPYTVGQGLLDPQQFIASPWSFNERQDLEAGTYSILHDYKFNMKQNAGRAVGNEEQRYNTLYKNVDIYHSINKKVEFLDFSELNDPNNPDPNDLKKPPFEYRLWSDQPKLLDGGGSLLPVYRYPQFQGKVIYYYSAT